MSCTRFDKLQNWINSECNTKSELVALNNDASFRKYYRFNSGSETLVAVDSPPDKENNTAFLSIQEILEENLVRVPKVIKYNTEDGFFLIEYLGDKLILSDLKNTKFPEEIYRPCIDELLKIQLCDQEYINRNYKYNIPIYNSKLLLSEMELFREWFLKQYLEIDISDRDNLLFNELYNLLINNAIEQPQILVHRDFHSRNLMLIDNNKIGVIDFQDAVWGPLTYDLVSLYRDCYISWPLDKIKVWCEDYYNKAKSKHVIENSISFEQYWQWFLLMTLQRNLKTIGIFARLYIRDNKSNYLNDIPRTLNYFLDITNYLSEKYKILDNCNKFIINNVKNKLDRKLNCIINDC